MEECRSSLPARPHGPRWPLLGLLALLGLSSVLHARMISKDTVPAMCDSADYYRDALSWWQLADKGRWGELGRALLRPHTRPPLPRLVTSALFAVTGETSLRMARLSLLVFLWVLLLSTYGLAARLQSRPAGLVAATLVVAYPQVVGFARLYWMDLPLAAMTTLSLHALVGAGDLRRPGRAAWLGVTLGLGLLTKHAFAIFVLGPLAATGLRALWGLRRLPAPSRPPHLRRLLLSLALAALICLVVAGPWLLPMAADTWRNLLFNLGSASASGARPVWSLPSLTGYLKPLYTHQVGPVLLSFFLLALPVFVRHGSSAARWLLLPWVGLPLVVFSFLVRGGLWSRFTLPLLPALALITALGLLCFRFSWLWRGAALAACMVAVVTSLRLSYARPPAMVPGQLPWKRAMGAGLLAPQSLDHLPLSGLFPPPAGLRGRFIWVALLPDVDCLGSALHVRALEERLPLLFAAPYEPTAPSLGGHPFPRRLDDPAYLSRYPYVVQVISPLGRAPDLGPAAARYARMARLWRALRDGYEPVAEHWLPSAHLLLVYRRSDRVLSAEQ